MRAIGLGTLCFALCIAASSSAQNDAQDPPVEGAIGVNDVLRSDLIPLLGGAEAMPLPPKSAISNLKGANAQISTLRGDVVVSPDSKVVDNLASITCPTGKAGLTDGWDVFAYVLDRNAAIAMDLYASADLKVSDKVVLYQFMWYKNVTDSGGEVIGRCGSGISLSLRVGSANADLKMSLASLAASSQLNLAQADYRIGTFGISGPPIDAAIPSASRIGTFDADAYAALMGALDKVQQAGQASGVVFTPSLVAMVNDGQAATEMKRAIMQVYALRSIASGLKCSQARAAVPNRDSQSDAFIKQVYRAHSSASACNIGDGGPSATDKAKAKQELVGFGLSPS